MPHDANRRRSTATPAAAPAAALAAAMLACLAGGRDAHATLPSGNPISGSIPRTSWSLELEDVVTIPNSESQIPRLEDLTFGGAPGLAYVIDQRGPIYTFDPAAANPTPRLFFDVYDTVPNRFLNPQAGLRGLAFHPDFNRPGAAGHRKFYTALSRNAFTPSFGSPKFFNAPNSISHDSIVAEWTVDASGGVVPGSYRELLGVGQPLGDHNIGRIAFNPTAEPGDADYGNLYITLGDGGGPANPNGTAQDLSTLATGSGGRGFPHGSILRIDPLASGGAPFTVPGDNPFVGQANTIQEVWAYGLRNPHKIGFDPLTGESYIADIGQSNIEEVNRGVAGANYGWSVREGTFDFEGEFFVGDLPAGHASDPFTYPVVQYDHNPANDDNGPGSWAIAGAEVYRGSIPQLRGRLLFGDFANNPGPLYAVGVDTLIERDDFSDVDNLSGGHLAPLEEIRLTENGVEQTLSQIVGSSRSDIRLAQGPDGEIYLLNKRDGVIRRFEAVSGLLAGDFDENGVVSAADYASFRDRVGTRFAPADHGAFAAGFGGSLSASSPAGVPEPGAAALMLLAAGGLAPRRR